MRAYETYNRPLTVAEKNRYLAEQAVIGRMGGADWVPETVAELDAYVERMRPLMAMNDQTVEFIAFLAGRVGDQPVGVRERYDRWVGIRASMGLMPEWARRMTGTYVPELAVPSLVRAERSPEGDASSAGRTRRCRARRWRWRGPRVRRRASPPPELRGAVACPASKNSRRIEAQRRPIGSMGRALYGSQRVPIATRPISRGGTDVVRSQLWVRDSHHLPGRPALLHAPGGRRCCHE